MEYEENYEPQLFNYRLLVILCICALIFGIMIYPILIKENKPVEKPEVKPSTVTEIIYRDVYIQPTLDGKIYFASEYETGTRKIKRDFSFYREDVLGLKDLSIHSQVYDYRIFNSYTWFNPTDYKYYKQYPVNQENKFLFVFFSIYSDDVIGHNVGYWIPTEKNMVIQVNDMNYYPIEFKKSLRIKELENSFNYNENSMATAYNSNRVYSSSSEYIKTAGEHSESIDVLKGGKSNAIDGYIIFEIPKNVKDEDILFGVNYNNFGNSFWRLKP